jgi:hypothetical protein
MRTHHWFKITKTLNFLFCGRCGLIALKNKETKKLVNRACPGKETDDGR